MGAVTAVTAGSLVAAREYNNMQVSWDNLAEVSSRIADTADKIERIVEDLKAKVEDCDQQVKSAESRKDRFCGLPELPELLIPALNKAKEKFQELKQQAEKAREKTCRSVAISRASILERVDSLGLRG